MKSFQNSTTGILANDKNEKITFAELAISCCNNPPKDGFTPEEMSARIRIIDVLKKGGEKIQLEDADASKLKELVPAMRWKILHEDIIKFSEAMKAL